MPEITIQNPFHQIYESPKCQKPYEFPLPEFPLLLDIELTNACNLDCLMCPRQLMKRKIGFMQRVVFEKIISEAALYKPGIRFIRFGEPLLHKEIFSFVKLAKERSLICHITSNGLLMDKDTVDKVILSGLDSVIFSFQGSNQEEYEKMRNNKGYDLLKSNISHLKMTRDNKALDRPFIHITTTLLDESEEEKNMFLKEWQELSDRVDYWYTSLLRLSALDRVKPLLLRQRVKEMAGKGRCTEVMTKLSINWNGDVTACCGDYDDALVVGSILNNSLKEIWHSEKLDRIRDTLSKGQRKEIPFCNLCTTKFVEKNEPV